MPKNSKTKLQFISSYYDTIANSHNNLNIETIVKVCTFLFYRKLNQNYSRFPCFVKNEIKISNKIYGIFKTKSMVLYYKVPTAPFTFLKIVCLRIPLPFS
jgi:hypothetical protein